MRSANRVASKYYTTSKNSTLLNIVTQQATERQSQSNLQPTKVRVRMRVRGAAAPLALSLSAQHLCSSYASHVSRSLLSPANVHGSRTWPVTSSESLPTATASVRATVATVCSSWEQTAEKWRRKRLAGEGSGERRGLGLGVGGRGVGYGVSAPPR